MVGRTIPSHNNKETNAGAWTGHSFVTRSRTKRFVTINFLVRGNLLGVWDPVRLTNPPLRISCPLILTSTAVHRHPAVELGCIMRILFYARESRESPGAPLHGGFSLPDLKTSFRVGDFRQRVATGVSRITHGN